MRKVNKKGMTIMDVKEALEFLREHQPMPSDLDLDKKIIDKYDEVRKFFLVYREPECIPLLLNSFGTGSGFGVYQLIEDVIKKYDSYEVIRHLKMTLKSSYKSIRYWNIQIASCFPTKELLETLSELLDEDDFDIKYAALTAIGQIDDEEVLDVIKDFQEKEKDLELQELAQEIVDEIEN